MSLPGRAWQGVAVALLLQLHLLCTVAYAYHDGDYIHASRKSQFHQRRTNWQDLLGQHCPRFGMDRLVALPVPQPQLPFVETDSYKLQLSFNGDRLLTQWLPVIGQDAPDIPLVHVRLRRSGDEVLGVAAEVVDAPAHYKDLHPLLATELKNVTHWPKHVLLRYEWITENDVDLDRGLYVLFAIGIAAVLLLMLNALRGMHAKLAQFLQEVTSDDQLGPGGVAVWKGSAKGD